MLEVIFVTKDTVVQIPVGFALFGSLGSHLFLHSVISNLFFKLFENYLKKFRYATLCALLTKLKKFEFSRQKFPEIQIFENLAMQTKEIQFEITLMRHF